ncbi:MAG: AMP-binding protein, partial [Candidatus Eremiobacterota bacterium]
MTPFDALDGISHAELARAERDGLLKLSRWARRRVPFYRGLPELESPERLQQVACLTKDDVARHGPAGSMELLAGPLRRAVVFQSGGTTGNPKYAAYSHRDYRRLCRTTGRTLWAPGLRSEDRCANMFAVGELYASFLTIHRGLEEVGAASFPFTFHAPQDQVYEALPRFRINTVMGLATQMVRLCDRVLQEGRPDIRIRKLFYAAEHLYPEDRQRLQEELQLEVIATAGYGAVDVGMIGYQCPSCPGSVHHVLGGSVVLEILDEAGNVLREPGASGQLVVTSLERYLQPVVRYRVGDLGRWVEGDCPCGRASPRFELLGRGDDTLRIGYETVTLE